MSKDGKQQWSVHSHKNVISMENVRQYSPSMFTPNVEDPELYTFFSLSAGVFSIMTKSRIAGLACVMLTVLQGISLDFSSSQEVRQFMSSVMVALFSLFSIYFEPAIKAGG